MITEKMSVLTESYLFKEAVAAKQIANVGAYITAELPRENAKIKEKLEERLADLNQVAQQKGITIESGAREWRPAPPQMPLSPSAAIAPAGAATSVGAAPASVAAQRS